MAAYRRGPPAHDGRYIAGRWRHVSGAPYLVTAAGIQRLGTERAAVRPGISRTAARLVCRASSPRAARPISCQGTADRGGSGHRPASLAGSATGPAPLPAAGRRPVAGRPRRRRSGSPQAKWFNRAGERMQRRLHRVNGHQHDRSVAGLFQAVAGHPAAVAGQACWQAPGRGR